MPHILDFRGLKATKQGCYPFLCEIKEFLKLSELRKRCPSSSCHMAYWLDISASSNSFQGVLVANFKAFIMNMKLPVFDQAT